MSLLKKATMLGAAGTAASGGLYVEDVFSTYLYSGNGSTKTITNGIDLDGEGGLVWAKNRDTNGYYHVLQDTVQGGDKYLSSNVSNSAAVLSPASTFSSNGYSINTSGAYFNASSKTYVSWTFRKAQRFFDVVTWDGNDVNGRSISHNLGVEPGFIIVKSTSTSTFWPAYHRSLGEGHYLFLDTTDAKSVYDGGGINTRYWNNTAPTDSTFTVSNDGWINSGGRTYVAYLFAHNDGDGGFGENGDQDIIKCGSYEGTGTTPYPEIDLGWEPQYLLVKNADYAQVWNIIDVMRGWIVDGYDTGLFANLSNAEDTVQSFGHPTPTGFKVGGSEGSLINRAGDTYIYIAIRRPMKTPTSGSEVFAVDTMGSTGDGNMPAFRAGFPPDFALFREVNTTYHTRAYDRLRNAAYLLTSSTNAESGSGTAYWSHMNGFYGVTATSSNHYSWMFRRAPGFFDVVCYTSPGTSPDPQTYNHNLTVEPELIIVKNRDNTYNWVVYQQSLGASNLTLDGNYAAGILSARIESATSTTFTVGTQGQAAGGTNENYIAYLFASQDGISKVGSYTGNGTSQNIDCGFSTGARFVLIKRTDDSGDWHVWDTARGIVTGNDPFLELNTTNAQNSSYDSVDPYSAGFSVNQDAGTNVNVSSGTYIFLAIS